MGGETDTLSILSKIRLQERGWGLEGISQDALVSMSPLKAVVATKLERTVVASSARNLSLLPGPSWGPKECSRQAESGHFSFSPGGLGGGLGAWLLPEASAIF